MTTRVVEEEDEELIEGRGGARVTPSRCSLPSQFRGLSVTTPPPLMPQFSSCAGPSSRAQEQQRPTSPMRRARHEGGGDGPEVVEQLRAYCGLLESQNETLGEQNELLKRDCAQLRQDVEAGVTRRRRERDQLNAQVQSLLASKRALEFKIRQEQQESLREISALRREIEALSQGVEILESFNGSNISPSSLSGEMHFRCREFSYLSTEAEERLEEETGEEDEFVCADDKAQNTTQLTYHTAGEGEGVNEDQSKDQEEAHCAAAAVPEAKAALLRRPSKLEIEAGSIEEDAGVEVVGNTDDNLTSFLSEPISWTSHASIMFDYAENATTSSSSAVSLVPEGRNTHHHRSLSVETENLTLTRQEDEFDTLINIPERLVNSPDAPEWLDLLIEFAKKLENQERSKAAEINQISCSATRNRFQVETLNRTIRKLSKEIAALNLTPCSDNKLSELPTPTASGA